MFENLEHLNFCQINFKPIRIFKFISDELYLTDWDLRNFQWEWCPSTNPIPLVNTPMLR